jgi:hypothetical protein
MKKIKDFVKYYVYLQEQDSYKKIKIKEYFNEREHMRFRIIKNTLNYNLKHMELMIRSLTTYTVNMTKVNNGTSYKNFSNISIEEFVDFDSRTVHEYQKYHILNLDHYKRNLIEQYRIFHVLKSLLNKNPLYKIDKNFNENLLKIMFEYLETEINN